jgi:hypothetical protein
MQFSPYRVQLAGVRTAAVQYRKLLREIVMVGTISGTQAKEVSVEADVFEKDLAFLMSGTSVKGYCDLFPGRVPFVGHIVSAESISSGDLRSSRVRVRLSDPDGELRAGMLLTLRLDAAIIRLPWWRHAVTDEWRNRTAVELAAHSLLAPAGLVEPGGLRSLLQTAVDEAMNVEGMGLAIPHSAVIDHGTRKVAFVESGPGMFDAVEIAVGPRCGDLYPVLRGVEAGQRMVASGALLLDAEMSLNHGVAATYFGATRAAGSVPASGGGPQATPRKPSQPEYSPATPDDGVIAARQQVCPVTGHPLDSMGGPVRLEVAGKTVFVCCKGCEAPLRKSPEKYLAKLPSK